MKQLSNQEPTPTGYFLLHFRHNSTLLVSYQPDRTTCCNTSFHLISIILPVMLHFTFSSTQIFTLTTGTFPGIAFAEANRAASGAKADKFSFPLFSPLNFWPWVFSSKKKMQLLCECFSVAALKLYGRANLSQGRKKSSFEQDDYDDDDDVPVRSSSTEGHFQYITCWGWIETALHISYFSLSKVHRRRKNGEKKWTKV